MTTLKKLDSKLLSP